MSRPFVLARVFAIGIGLGLLCGNMDASAQDEPNPIVSLVKQSGANPEKPFVLHVVLKAKPGMGTKLVEAFSPAIVATRKEKGCLQYDLSKDTAGADSYLLYEHWETLADLEAHLASKHITKLLADLSDTSAGPPEATVFVPVGP